MRRSSRRRVTISPIIRTRLFSLVQSPKRFIHDLATFALPLVDTTETHTARTWMRMLVFSPLDHKVFPSAFAYMRKRYTLPALWGLLSHDGITVLPDKVRNVMSHLDQHHGV
jgi:hypothetical protein